MDLFSQRIDVYKPAGVPENYYCRETLKQDDRTNFRNDLKDGTCTDPDEFRTKQRS